MTKKEALALLELDLYASSHDIESTYRKQYNEYQIRITNAPTASQRTKFQEKLAELDTAYGVLKGDSSENIQNELPSVTPVASASGNTIEASRKSSKQLSNEDAKNVLGLSANYSKRELENAYQVKKAACEESIRNAFNKEVENAYRDAHIEIESAYKVLSPRATVEKAINGNIPKSKHIEGERKASSGLVLGMRKGTLLIFGSGLVVIVLLLLFLTKGTGKNVLGEEADQYLSEIHAIEAHAEQTRNLIQEHLFEAEDIYDNLSRKKQQAVENDLDEMRFIEQDAEATLEEILNISDQATAAHVRYTELGSEEELEVLGVLSMSSEEGLREIEDLQIRMEDVLNLLMDAKQKSSTKNSNSYSSETHSNNTARASVFELNTPYDGQVFSTYPRELFVSWPDTGSDLYMVQIEYSSSGSNEWAHWADFTTEKNNLDPGFVGAQPGRVRVVEYDKWGSMGRKTSWVEFRFTQ